MSELFGRQYAVMLEFSANLEIGSRILGVWQDLWKTLRTNERTKTKNPGWSRKTTFL